MKLLFKLAYRNLWRNSRRTLLTMSAMGMATAVVIITLGIYDGMLWDMIEGATELYHGQVKITAKQYMEKRQINLTIPENGLKELIENDSRVKGIAGRVRGFALLSFGEGDASHTQPAELFGIEPVEERSVSRLADHVIEGTFLSDTSSDDILLGKGLARLLEAEVGGEIVAMGQGADGSIAAGIFHVVGIIDTGDPLRDVSLSVVGRKTLQEMLVLEGRLHEYSISLKRSLEAEEWASDLKLNDMGMEVTPWNVFLPQMGSIFEMWGAIKFIFALIFYFAVILVTTNTMYMSFLERIREFGIMGAVGLKSKRLSLMIIFEGFLLSSLAGLFGGLVGILISFYLKEHYIDLSGFISQISFGETTIQPRIRTYPALDNMLYPIVMLIVLGIIVSLFPANKVRRLRPVEVLREV